jgi:hypothetical protein
MANMSLFLNLIFYVMLLQDSRLKVIQLPVIKPEFLPYFCPVRPLF